jgi:nucleoside-diphosphate-sugar epimerase
MRTCGCSVRRDTTIASPSRCWTLSEGWAASGDVAPDRGSAHTPHPYETPGSPRTTESLGCRPTRAGRLLPRRIRFHFSAYLRGHAVPERDVHVVFGAGQVGRALAAQLTGRDLPTRVVSRTRPTGLGDDVDWRAADVTDPEAARDAAKGASVVYQCLNAPYTKWPELFPPLQRGVMAAAEHTEALMVSLENLYGYGPTAEPMTEDLPLAATTKKGSTRAAMTNELLAAAEAGRIRIAIGRASDFFGPGVTGTTLGERVFAKALAGHPADVLGDPDLLHTYSYVPDIAAGLATLGTDERAIGQVWHLPGPETVTTRAVLDLVADAIGQPVRTRGLPELALRALGVVSPLMRGLAEMSYEFDRPFVLDTTKYQTTFGSAGTPLPVAITDTVDWYRSRRSAR